MRAHCVDIATQSPAPCTPSGCRCLNAVDVTLKASSMPSVIVRNIRKIGALSDRDEHSGTASKRLDQRDWIKRWSRPRGGEAGGPVRSGPVALGGRAMCFCTGCADGWPTVKIDGLADRRPWSSPTPPAMPTVPSVAPPDLLRRLGRRRGLSDHNAVGRYRGSTGNAEQPDRSRNGSGESHHSQCHCTLLFVPGRNLVTARKRPSRKGMFDTSRFPRVQ
jgi:hypothetical protein